MNIIRFEKLYITFLIVFSLLVSGVSFAAPPQKKLTPQEKKFESALIMTEILAFPQYTLQYCEKALTPEQNKEFTQVVRDWNVRHSAEFVYAVSVIYDLTNTRSLGPVLEQIVTKIIDIQRSDLKQDIKEYCTEQMVGYYEVRDFTLLELLLLDPNKESREFKKQAYDLIYGSKK